MRTALDTNILSALWSGEPSSKGIAAALGEAQAVGGLAISPAIYAELRAYPGAHKEFVDSFLEDTNIIVDWVLEDTVWQLAAERFAKYANRRRKSKTGYRRTWHCGGHAMV